MRDVSVIASMVGKKGDKRSPIRLARLPDREIEWDASLGHGAVVK
jgi:hypothetical protein